MKLILKFKAFLFCLSQYNDLKNFCTSSFCSPEVYEQAKKDFESNKAFKNKFSYAFHFYKKYANAWYDSRICEKCIRKNKGMTCDKCTK